MRDSNNNNYLAVYHKKNFSVQKNGIYHQVKEDQ